MTASHGKRFLLHESPVVFILSDNLKRLRKQHAWTQPELARRAGISPKTITNIESIRDNFSPILRLDVIERLASVFRLSVADLLTPCAPPEKADEEDLKKPDEYRDDAEKRRPKEDPVTAPPDPAYRRGSKLPPVEFVLSDNTKRLRSAMGWSQKELSRRSGLSQKTISNIETIPDHLSRIPSIDVIERLAIAFRVPMLSLLLPLADISDSQERQTQIIELFRHHLQIHEDVIRGMYWTAKAREEYTDERIRDLIGFFLQASESDKDMMMRIAKLTSFAGK